MKMDSLRTDDLIDLRHNENNGNGDVSSADGNHDIDVPDRITVNDSTITLYLPTDKDSGNEIEDPIESIMYQMMIQTMVLIIWEQFTLTDFADQLE